ncbi:putative assembly protein [Vibrio aerogenes CECT 7868]|uniref:Putative assembly protein n=1 Tax=Vibrio aerogenes CECT 7868 TaxID=1216006 RepID=A0A1M6B630_9VIBR|nr:AsmA family protein [Vibrio aerogenes]SHI44214.1 putative assembly protein [Vibrio aerogenes CECT 7868]
MKKLLYVIVGLLVVVIGAMILLVTLVDPNQYKPLIVEQTKRATGLDLVVTGDLKWQFFPSVGLHVGQVALKNPPGFERDNLLEVKEAAADVSVMPLFSQQLHIGQIRLDGMRLDIETRKDGVSNLDSLKKNKVSEPQSKPATQAPAVASSSSSDTAGESSGHGWQVTVAGIAVTHAHAEIRDAAAGKQTILSDLNLNISEFLPGQWTGFELSGQGRQDSRSFSVQGLGNFQLAADYGKFSLKDLDLQASVNGESLPLNPLKIALKGQMDMDLVAKVIQLTGLDLKFNDVQIDGQSTITLNKPMPQVRFSLHSPDIDLDRLLPASAAKSPANPDAQVNQSLQSNKNVQSTQAAQTVSSQEPDLTGLKTLDVSGDLRIDRLKVKQVVLTDVALKTSVQQGIARLIVTDAGLYQGKIKADIQLNGRQVPATYQVNQQMTGVQIQPLLKALAENDQFEGTGTVKVNVAGKGLSGTRLKKNLYGTVRVELADGAINGINIAQLIRRGYAKIKGRSLPDNAVQKTDFSALSGTFNLKQGIAATRDLSMMSPLLRVHGEGQVNYLNQSQDMLVRTSFVGSLQGQGGKDIDELRDITIPLKVTGNWQKPHYKVVFDDVLKQKAKKELNRGLKKLDEKIKDEKTREAVNNLLKKLF